MKMVIMMMVRYTLSSYRPLSCAGHFVSGDLKKLCLCMASLVLS